MPGSFRISSCEAGKPSCRDCFGGGVQIARPAVITESAPCREHVLLGRLCQLGHGGELPEKALIVRDHRFHTRLLQHDLRNPDPVEIGGLPPREIALRCGEPVDEGTPEGSRRDQSGRTATNSAITRNSSGPRSKAANSRFSGSSRICSCSPVARLIVFLAAGITLDGIAGGEIGFTELLNEQSLALPRTGYAGTKHAQAAIRDQRFHRSPTTRATNISGVSRRSGTRSQASCSLSIDSPNFVAAARSPKRGRWVTKG